MSKLIVSSVSATDDKSIARIIQEGLSKHNLIPLEILDAVAAESLITYLLAREGMTYENTRLGTVVCFDDISFQIPASGRTHPSKNVITKLIRNFGGAHMPLGNLGGMMMGGSVGIGALSHHLPKGEDGEPGNLFIFAGAHIGYSESEGFGKCIRPYQSKPSSNCGALVTYATNVEDLPAPDHNPAWTVLCDMLEPVKDQIIDQKELQDKILRTTVLAHKGIIKQTYRALDMAKEAGVFDNVGNVYVVEALQINTDKDKIDQYAIMNAVKYK